ncbi:MAG TPA: hypothetical protein VGS61_05940 [Acidimicrobiales bacterium]|nr:hypothetical protein [Acidimicrobiales bacterium]
MRGPRDATAVARRALFAWAVPVAGAALVAVRYSRTWFFYDEWGLIHMILQDHASLTSDFSLYAGHLWVTNRLVYEAQIYLAGVGGHAVIWAVLVASVALYLAALVALLRRFGVSPLAASAVALAVGLFGPGGELVGFEIDLAPVLALAIGLGAVAIALRRERPSTRHVAALAAALVVAALTDSGLALLALVYTTPLLLMRWPRRDAVLAIAPAAVIGVWVLTRPSPRFAAHTLGARIAFAWHLLDNTAAGLVHGGGGVGAVALGLAVAGVGWRARRGDLSGLAIASLVGGLLAVLAALATLAETRSLYPLTPGIRYYAEVAPFLALAFLPSLRGPRPATWTREALLAGLAALVFALNLGSFLQGEVTIETWATTVHDGFPAAVWLATHMCPNGATVPNRFEPFGSLSPQVTVGLIRDLRREGMIAHVTVARPTAAALSLDCPRTSTGSAPG